MAELAHHIVAETTFAKGFAQSAESGHIADFLRHNRSVEIGAEAYTFDAEMLNQIVDVTQHLVERCVGIDLAVGSQEAGREVKANHAARLANGSELSIRQVARVLTNGMDIRMCRDQGCRAQARHVPEASLVEMREVDGDAELVAGFNQSLAGVGEAGASVGTGGEAEGYPV